MASIWVLIKGWPTMLWSWAHRIFNLFFSAGTQVIKCFGVWHSPCLKLGGFVTLSDGPLTLSLWVTGLRHGLCLSDKGLSLVLFEWRRFVTVGDGCLSLNPVECRRVWHLSVWVSGTLALECRRVWHRKVERFLADECLSVWHSGTGVSCGLALNPFECRRVWHSPCLGRLGAIRLQDCVQLYSQIAGLRAITQ